MVIDGLVERKRRLTPLLCISLTYTLRLPLLVQHSVYFRLLLLLKAVSEQLALLHIFIAALSTNKIPAMNVDVLIIPTQTCLAR